MLILSFSSQVRVREFVKNYAVYCEYRECEVVDMFSKAKNLKWVDGIRNNKK